MTDHVDPILRALYEATREEARCQQAIDALREIDTYIKDLAYPGPETNWIAGLVSDALLSLGEQP